MKVHETALLTAAYRAGEAERPDALFSDPFAARLAGERGRSLAREAKGSAIWEMGVAVRTRVIDDLLFAAFADEAIELVVDLGAGLDTRPYRLAVPPGVRWIEVDVPEIFAQKNAVLEAFAPACPIEQLSLDLLDLAARGAFFDRLAREGRILVLCEGLLSYFSPSEVGVLARDLHAVPGVRGWIFDHTTPFLIDLAARTWPAAAGRPGERFAPDDVGGFFAAHGWGIARAVQTGETAAAFGRVAPWPALAELIELLPVPEMADREHWRSGCVLLKPKR